MNVIIANGGRFLENDFLDKMVLLVFVFYGQ